MNLLPQLKLTKNQKLNHNYNSTFFHLEKPSDCSDGFFYIYEMEKAIIQSPLGTTLIYCDEIGVTKIEVVEEALEISSDIPVQLQDAVLQLQEYFEGKRNHFSFTLHPIGTAFQQKVWDELRNIPYGTTCSYLDVAKKLGDVKAIRAVAAANGKNPLWIVVPCHRVIGSNGSLTGYAGGLWRKKWLLEHENPSAQKSLF